MPAGTPYLVGEGTRAELELDEVLHLSTGKGLPDDRGGRVPDTLEVGERRPRRCRASPAGVVRTTSRARTKALALNPVSWA